MCSRQGYDGKLQLIVHPFFHASKPLQGTLAIGKEHETRLALVGHQIEKKTAI